MMKVVLGFIFFIVIVLYGTWVFGTSAQAHEWFTGKRNPGTNENCCNSVDCRVIGNDDWWMEDSRLFVKWSDGRTYSMPAVQALPTEDAEGKPAACVLAGRLRCAFIPLGF